jgi:hypothetical protein
MNVKLLIKCTLHRKKGRKARKKEGRKEMVTGSNRVKDAQKGEVVNE